VILIDANLLLYAYDTESPQHDRARAWLTEVLSGGEEVRIPLTTALAFLRIGTNAAVFHRPLDPARALAIVESWFEREGVALALPTDQHWRTLGTSVESGQARGPLMSDAHLAALTIEHGGVLMTTDRDFARFEGLKFSNPIAPGKA
jgi:toxin-antitoxin system PIN domain toxin